MFSFKAWLIVLFLWQTKIFQYFIYLLIRRLAFCFCLCIVSYVSFAFETSMLCLKNCLLNWWWPKSWSSLSLPDIFLFFFFFELLGSVVSLCLTLSEVDIVICNLLTRSEFWLLMFVLWRTVNFSSNKSILGNTLHKFPRYYIPRELLKTTASVCLILHWWSFRVSQLPNTEVWFQRPKDIVRKLLSGDLDLGIVGLDTVCEYGQVRHHHNQFSLEEL